LIIKILPFRPRPRQLLPRMLEIVSARNWPRLPPGLIATTRFPTPDRRTTSWLPSACRCRLPTTWWSCSRPLQALLQYV